MSLVCRACGEGSPQGARFCMHCAAPFASLCAGCGAELPEAARFCPSCGQPAEGARARPQPATEATPAPPTPPADASAPRAEHAEDSAERRQLSVLFCDLVDSTRLAASCDPEDWRELVRAYQAGAGEVVASFGGHVAQYLGDGILVYFGYPHAHEDDAERALRAGLGIVEAVERLGARLGGAGQAELAVRVAVHTGAVVVGAMGEGSHRETLALGDATNLAARLQGEAEPGTVVTSDATLRLVQGVFLVDALGARRLKGVADPVALHRVVRPSGMRSRLDLAGASLTPLMGREQEVALLLDRWEQAREGLGQVLLLSGDAGMGKSRLVQVLRERLRDARHTWLECRCSPYHERSALHPVVELLQQGLQLEPGEPAAQKLAKLEAAVRPLGLPPEETAALLAGLLSIPLPGTASLPALSPEARRRRTLESLTAWLFQLAELQPTVLVVEDLHWVDPSTLELLGTVLEQAPTAPLLLLFTFRPGFESPWGNRSHLSHITMGRLTRRQVEGMVTSLAGGKPLPAAVVEQVARKTDGVPLFVEELTKTVLESDLLAERDERFELTRPLLEIAIPSTLQDSLMARLDRLEQAKGVAQLASVVGREFSYELLEAIASLEPEALRAALERLVAAELLYQRGIPPRATYSFKHALVQDTAYQSLLKRRRQEVHGKIALVLEERFAETVEAEPEVVAQHYAEAGMASHALRYYERAGRRAAERSANAEAIEHFGKALLLLRALPEGRERDTRELALHVALGTPMIAARGYGDAEVKRVYERAREIARALGEAPQLPQAMWGLCAFYQASGELKAAFELGEQLLEKAEQSGDARLLVLGHLAIGIPAYFAGEEARAAEHLAQSAALYDEERDAGMGYEFGQDPGVFARGYAALASWQLGHVERALAESREAVALARRVGHPFSLAFALGFGAGLRQMMGRVDEAFALGDEAARLSGEQDIPLWLGLGMVTQGWARARKGEGDAAVAHLQQGMALMAQTGTEVGGPWMLLVLFEALLAAGRRDEAKGILDGALALSAVKGNRFFEPELLLRKADLVVAADPTARAQSEALLERALAIARERGQTLFAVRAAIELAPARSAAGRGAEAREILEPLLAELPDDLDAPELGAAQALLDALAG